MPDSYQHRYVQEAKQPPDFWRKVVLLAQRVDFDRRDVDRYSVIAKMSGASR
jgi:hypothetical protein